jgi:hypothetical protein
MSIKFPSADAARDRIAQLPADEFRLVSIMAELLAFQANTIDAMADYLVTEARKFELTNRTITFAELKAAGATLRQYAQTLAPTDPEAITK